MKLPGSTNDKRGMPELGYPALAAQKFIRLFSSVKPSNHEEQTMLAAAYYTLSTDTTLSCSRSKMHVNSAISLLKNIREADRKISWHSQIAQAYFKRAELLEEKDSFRLATIDYQQVIDTLETGLNVDPNNDTELLLIARSALSIADLIVHEQISRQESQLAHPLFYVNKALECLADIKETNDDIWTTHAYAHQIAGITLSQSHFSEAQEAFRVALLMLFKTESVRVCPLLADIYTCLGLLYEQQYHANPCEKTDGSYLDEAMIYFGLSLLFSPAEEEEDDNMLIALESLFEIIYRVLDPYLQPLSQMINVQLVDALLYAYMCVVDKALPNKTLSLQLEQNDTLDTYAQHIYWLVMEAYNKQTHRTDTLDILHDSKIATTLEYSHILQVLEQEIPDNLYFFPSITASVDA